MYKVELFQLMKFFLILIGHNLLLLEQNQNIFLQIYIFRLITLLHYILFKNEQFIGWKHWPFISFNNIFSIIIIINCF